MPLEPISPIRIVCVSFIAAGACASSISPAAEPAWPVKPIRFVVPFAPGGPTDIIARAVAQKLAELTSVPVVIDNRGGAGGNIGAEIVARSVADGYTILMAATSTHAINASLYTRLGFDPIADFAPVTLVSSTPTLLAVYPGVPATNVRELIQLARARPGEISYASAGNGSSNHLAGVMLGMMAGIDLVHVPYKGSGPALLDVISGQVPMMFNNMASITQYVRAGRLRALAVTSSQRSTLMPELPTVAESGLPGFEARSWHGVIAPAKTPAAIVGRLHMDIVRGLSDPALRARLEPQGVELVGNSPAEFSAFIRSESTKWAKVVKASGARAD
jgi:tripartite-type tricarboxylate transporter receptor subunit TctC